jgi:hypothetical protein
MRCKRCGSRVVSNVDHCPFCGKNLRPIFMRLWFWLIVVVLLSAAMIFFLLNGIPAPEPVQPSQPSQPVVVGAEEGASYKDLELGATVDVDGLLVTVTGIEDGPIAHDGSQVKVLTALFSNKRSDAVTLFSTQWQMQTADGNRLDTYIGTTAEDESITSNFEAFELAPDNQFTGRLYFSGGDLARAVYSPNALNYDEVNLVTWVLPQATSQDDSSSQ